MEFDVVSLERSLDLSQNYKTVQVGPLAIGLQGVKDDAAEIEIQGPDGVDKIMVPVGAAATAQGHTFILRDVGVKLPNEKKRRSFRLFGNKKDDTPKDGLMEAIFDIRWGDQSMKIEDPDKNEAYDFMLVRQYEVVNDRPKVYHGQDVLRFDEMRLEIGERVEEGSRNFKKARYADFIVQIDDEDEPEEWQIKLDGKYHRKGKYRVRVTSYDWENGWYQAYGISVVRGKPKDYIDETEEMIADGIAADAHVGHTDALSLSETRLQEAEKSDNENIFSEGQSRNIGKVGIKVMKVKPGEAEIMILSPTVKKTRLIHGQVFEVGRYDITLVGVHSDKAIIRVEED